MVLISPIENNENDYLKLSIKNNQLKKPLINNNNTRPITATSAKETGTDDNSNSATSASRQDIFFDEIISIEYVGEEHVYDLMIENTHNFIANDIVAHNTYIDDKVGVGTAEPKVELEVEGGVNISGGLNVTDGDVLLATTGGRVGI